MSLSIARDLPSPVSEVRAWCWCRRANGPLSGDALPAVSKANGNGCWRASPNSRKTSVRCASRSSRERSVLVASGDKTPRHNKTSKNQPKALASVLRGKHENRNCGRSHSLGTFVIYLALLTVRQLQCYIPINQNLDYLKYCVAFVQKLIVMTIQILDLYSAAQCVTGSYINLAILKAP